MSRGKKSDNVTPNIYDTEKLIDIHSSEADPSFDAKKVREVTKSVTRSKDPYNSSDVSVT